MLGSRSTLHCLAQSATMMMMAGASLCWGHALAAASCFRVVMVIWSSSQATHRAGLAAGVEAAAAEEGCLVGIEGRV